MTTAEILPASERRVPVLYLDIDGTVRHGYDELGRWVNGPDDVVIFDGVVDLLREYRRRGWRIVGVSNQGGIALGHVTMNRMAATMLRTQALTGDAFDKVAWCSHHPAATDPEMAVCWCRKPRPGLVIETALALAEKHREMYPPHMGLMVGDRDEDRGCAANAGLPFMDAATWRTGAHLTDTAQHA